MPQRIVDCEHHTNRQIKCGERLPSYVRHQRQQERYAESVDGDPKNRVIDQWSQNGLQNYAGPIYMNEVGGERLDCGEGDRRED